MSLYTIFTATPAPTRGNVMRISPNYYDGTVLVLIQTQKGDWHENWIRRRSTSLAVGHSLTHYSINRPLQSLSLSGDVS